MKIEEIQEGDVLVNVDERGCGYYRVVKVNRVTVDVIGENGNRVRAYPHIFNRRVRYEVPTLPHTKASIRLDKGREVYDNGK